MFHHGEWKASQGQISHLTHIGAHCIHRLAREFHLGGRDREYENADLMNAGGGD